MLTILNIILTILILLIIFIFIFIKYIFLREPKRQIPKGNNIISPANGKIISIKKIDKNLDNLEIKKGHLGKIKTLTNFLKNQEAVMISIMMNLQNIHIQKSPLDAKVISTKYNKGKFNNAVFNAKEMNWLENENLETIIENKEIGQIKIIQIAGLLARRCVTFLKPNQEIKKGEKIGLIKLGSQVTIIIPTKNIKLKVKENQKVIEGETILADIKSEKN